MLRKILAIVFPVFFIIIGGVITLAGLTDDSTLAMLALLVSAPWNLALMIVFGILGIIIQYIFGSVPSLFGIALEDIAQSVAFSAGVIINAVILRLLVLRVGNKQKPTSDPNKTPTI